MDHWHQKLPNLSIEQLQALIKELGEIAILTRELNAKLLMAALPGLDRDDAITLVSAQESIADEGERHRQVLQLLFVRHQLTVKQIGQLRPYLGGFGLKVLARALWGYSHDPAYKGTEEAIGVLLREMQRQAEAEGRIQGEKLEDVFDSCDQESPDLRMREILRDDWGIESAADFEMLILAMALTAKKNQNEWMRGNRQQLNVLTKKARRLYERGKANNVSPAKIVEWDDWKQTQNNPNAVFVRPDGIEVWGDGERVIRDKNGQPCRPMASLFGGDVPVGSIPSDLDMREWVRRAWPEG